MTIHHFLEDELCKSASTVYTILLHYIFYHMNNRFATEIPEFCYLLI